MLLLENFLVNSELLLMMMYILVKTMAQNSLLVYLDQQQAYLKFINLFNEEFSNNCKTFRGSINEYFQSHLTAKGHLHT